MLPPLISATKASSRPSRSATPHGQGGEAALRRGASLAAFGLTEPGGGPANAWTWNRISTWPWLGLGAAALWPHWLWASRRLADGSDEPLGIAALLVLAVALARLAPAWQPSATPVWAFLALGGVVVATAAHLSNAPALFGLLLAVLAMAAALRAFVPRGTPCAPLCGLALLAMPVIASLQFYAGHPLRLVTAQLSAWLLGAVGHEVHLSGTALQVDGQLVIVDAPCSGVQMLWVAYFCACTWAWHLRLSDRQFVRRLAGVGLIVLAGNVLRNTVLVALEARGAPVGALLHEAVGLAALAGVCTAVLRLVQGGRHGQG